MNRNEPTTRCNACGGDFEEGQPVSFDFGEDGHIHAYHGDCLK